MEFEAVPDRIGQVRRIVSAQLRYWHLAALIEPAALAVTELLTNVHQHAGPDKRCGLELALRARRLTISVRDHDPRLPLIRTAQPLDHHGRGLPLVAAVSDSWGCQALQDGEGKSVWFTLSLPAEPPEPAAETAAVREVRGRKSARPVR